MTLSRDLWRGGLWNSQAFANGLWRGGLWLSQRVGWTPAALFASGQQGVWYEPKPEYLYQDSAGTTPVTADGQPVGYVEDLSGNGNHATQGTAAKKPTYRTDGTLHWLEFDGVDDSLSTQSVPLSVTSVVSSFVGMRKLTDSSTGIVYEAGPAASSNNGAFYLSAPENSTRRLGLVTTDEAGSLVSGVTTSDDYLAPVDLALSAKHRSTAASADEARSLRANGQAVSLTSTINQSPLSGNFVDNRLYIGSRNNASIFLSARIFALIIVSDDAGTDDVGNTENYIANLTGVTL